MVELLKDYKFQSIGLEPDITLEEAEERCEEVFSTDILSGLGDSNWKNRFVLSLYLEKGKSFVS